MERVQFQDRASEGRNIKTGAGEMAIWCEQHRAVLLACPYTESACVSREGRRNGGLTILISHEAPPLVVLRCSCISSCTDMGTGTVGWDGVEGTWRQRKQEYWRKQESRGGNIWAISEGVCESRQEGCFHTKTLAEVWQEQESVY